MGLDKDGNDVRVSKRTGNPIPKPLYKDSPAAKAASEGRKNYKDKFCDTSAAEAARVTYRPSALSFEEEVLSSLRGLEIDWSRLSDVTAPSKEPRA
jgi:hypothetical protein